MTALSRLTKPLALLRDLTYMIKLLIRDLILYLETKCFFALRRGKYTLIKKSSEILANLGNFTNNLTKIMANLLKGVAYNNK